MNNHQLLESYAKSLAEENYEQVSEIISILNSLPPSSRKEALPFYQQIDKDLFDRSRSISNLSVSKFVQSIKDWEQKQTVENKVLEKLGNQPEEEKVEEFDQFSRAFTAGIPNCFKN